MSASSRIARTVDSLGLAMVSLIFLAAALPFAVAKPLTNDEIYTLHVAMQPSFGAVWSALASGADNHPPLDYWLRHAAMGVWGPNAFALRIPSVVAMLAAILCIYRVMQRWLSAQYGVGAVLLVLIAGGFEAALQTRGYALLLCWFGLSMLVWQSVATGQASWLTRAFFIVTVAGAAYSHYYGVLHGVAFALASLTDASRRLPLLRQPLPLVAAAGIISLPLWPLVQVASRFSDRFWTPVTMTSALAFYPSLLAPIIPCLVAIAVLTALVPAASTSHGHSESRPATGIPPETIYALVWFALMPLAMLVMARLVTGAFLPRYTIAAGAAIAMLSALLVSRVQGRPGRLAAIVALLPLVFLTVPVIKQVSGLRTHQFRIAFTATLDTFQRTSDQPVVVGDDGVFVEISQSDGERLANCVFLFDAFPDRPTNVDKAIKGLLQVWPIRALAYDAMKGREQGFAYIGAWGDRILDRALADGASVSPRVDAPSGQSYWQVTF